MLFPHCCRVTFPKLAACTGGAQRCRMSLSGVKPCVSHTRRLIPPARRHERQTQGTSMVTSNGGPAAQPAVGPQPQLNVLAQYVKDLSFENPNAPGSLQQQQQQQ